MAKLLIELEDMARIGELAALFQGQSGYYAAACTSEATRGYVEQCGKPKSLSTRAPAARKGALAVYAILQHVCSNGMENEFIAEFKKSLEKSEQHAIHLIEARKINGDKHSATKTETKP